MTKFIRVGIAYNLTGSRQFDFYVTDRLIIESARELVKQSYRALDNPVKGGENMKMTPQMIEAERRIADNLRKRALSRKMSRKRKI